MVERRHGDAGTRRGSPCSPHLRAPCQAPANNLRGASTSMPSMSDSATPSARRRGRKLVHRKSSPRPPLACSRERRHVSLPSTIRARVAEPDQRRDPLGAHGVRRKLLPADQVEAAERGPAPGSADSSPDPFRDPRANVRHSGRWPPGPGLPPQPPTRPTACGRPGPARACVVMATPMRRWARVCRSKHMRLALGQPIGGGLPAAPRCGWPARRSARRARRPGPPRSPGRSSRQFGPRWPRGPRPDTFLRCRRRCRSRPGRRCPR